MLVTVNMADRRGVLLFLVFLTFPYVLGSEETENLAPALDEDSEDLAANRVEDKAENINEEVKTDVQSDEAEAVGEKPPFNFSSEKNEDVFDETGKNAVLQSYENGIALTIGTGQNASEETENVVTNSTSQNATSEVNSTEAVVKPAGPKWSCIGGNHSKEFLGKVVVIDDTDLQKWINVTNNGSSCVLVLFYARFCRFCGKLAPLYNAVGRSYHSLPILAMDAYQHNSLNARFGIIAVPMVLLFHSGKPVLKFNNSNSLEEFRGLIKNSTGIEGNSSVEISEEDYEGPVQNTPTVEVDFYLIFASLFLLVLGCYLFVKSSYGQMVWDGIDRFPWHRIMHWFEREKQE